MNKEISKKIGIMLIVLLIVGCGIRTYILQNGITKVPFDSDVYNNRIYYNERLKNIIDTNVIFEEFNTRYRDLMRLDTHIETTVYGAYRFYSNGLLNYFVLNRNKPLNSINFDPNYQGYRGVYYLKNDSIIRYDLFAPIDERRNIGKISGTFSFVGDTLYEQRDPSKGIIKINYPQEVYIKRELPPGYLNYNADW